MTAVEFRIYLASSSPRRRELLHQIGVRFELLLFRTGLRADAEVNELALPEETPDAYVLRVAAAKAQHGAKQLMARHLPPRIVLAADTTLDLDGCIIGKPHDEADAEAILARLSGRTHRVLTAIAVAKAGQFDQIDSVLNVSTVRFRDLSADEIHRYVRTGEPLDKAGAYAIQGYAGMFVAEITGSHSGIMGLPLCETAVLLRKTGYPV